MIRRLLRAAEAIVHILLNPRKLYYVLENEESLKEKVRKQFGIPERGCKTIDFESLSITFPQKIPLHSFLGGTSAPTDFLLLRGLAKRFENCSYFEIGTWRGESIVNLQDVVATSCTLNLSGEELQKLGYSRDHTEVQGHYLKNLENTTILEGNSQTFDFSSIKRRFDLIFIDGDHHWKAVENDTRGVFQHLVHKDSIVVWHDYARNYSTIWWEVLYGILRGLPTPLHQYIYHVRNTNCLVYLPFEVALKVDSNPFLPLADYKVVIDRV